MLCIGQALIRPSECAGLAKGVCDLGQCASSVDVVPSSRCCVCTECCQSDADVVWSLLTLEPGCLLSSHRDDMCVLAWVYILASCHVMQRVRTATHVHHIACCANVPGLRLLSALGAAAAAVVRNVCCCCCSLRMCQSPVRRPLLVHHASSGGSDVQYVLCTACLSLRTPAVLTPRSVVLSRNC
jgi:hypothetical protein